MRKLPRQVDSSKVDTPAILCFGPGRDSISLCSVRRAPLDQAKGIGPIDWISSHIGIAVQSTRQPNRITTHKPTHLRVIPPTKPVDLHLQVEFTVVYNHT